MLSRRRRLAKGRAILVHAKRTRFLRSGLPFRRRDSSRREENRAYRPEASSSRLRVKPFQNRRAKSKSEEHTSELQSLMRISYAVFCLKNKTISFFFQYSSFLNY